MSAGNSSGPAPGPSGSTSVDVWVWPLDDPPRPHDELEGWLSRDEVERADRFKFPHLRSRWIAARAGMRCILASRLGPQPGELSFGLGHHGKPFLEGQHASFRFNLSHSEGLAALAMGDMDLGVDIEIISQFHESVARDHFSAAENGALQRLPPEQRSAAFYQFWTAKEAVLKTLGTGFSLASNSFTLGLGETDARQLIHADWPDTDKRNWQIVAFEPAPGFAGAVAARTAAPLYISRHIWK